MKRLILLMLVCAPMLATAQPPTTIQEAAIGSLMYTEGRIVQLAEAIPAEKYDWRPAEGVRSIAESIMHVAAGNYFITMTAGHTPPEGIDIMTLEKSVTAKSDVIAALKKSYEYARAGVQGFTKKQLDNMVEFPFPGEYNTRSALMIVTGHCEEHMGQLIAYARMNDIIPPWSE